MFGRSNINFETGEVKLTTRIIKDYLNELKFGNNDNNILDTFIMSYFTHKLVEDSLDQFKSSPFYTFQGQRIKVTEAHQLISYKDFFREDTTEADLLKLLTLQGEKIIYPNLVSKGQYIAIDYNSVRNVRRYLISKWQEIPMQLIANKLYCPLNLSHSKIDKISFTNLWLGSYAHQSASNLKSVTMANCIYYSSNLMNIDASQAIISNNTKFFQCDLSGINLILSWISHSHFEELLIQHAADLTYVTLLNSSLIKSIIKNTSFRASRIEQSSLQHCLFEQVSFGVAKTNLDYKSAVLLNVDVNHSRFIECSFYKADIGTLSNIENAKFIRCNFIDATFRHNEIAKKLFDNPANVSCIRTFEDLLSRLRTGENFSGYDLSFIDLSNKSNRKFPEKSLLQRVNFNHANLPQTAFAWCDLLQSTFENASLSQCLLTDSVLKGVSFYRATLSNTKFHKSNLSSSIFREVVFDFRLGANEMVSMFKGANLDHADFSDCQSINNANREIIDFTQCHSIKKAILPTWNTDLLIQRALNQDNPDKLAKASLKKLHQRGAYLIMSEECYINLCIKYKCNTHSTTELYHKIKCDLGFTIKRGTDNKHVVKKTDNFKLNYQNKLLLLKSSHDYLWQPADLNLDDLHFICQKIADVDPLGAEDNLGISAVLCRELNNCVWLANDIFHALISGRLEKYIPAHIRAVVSDYNRKSQIRSLDEETLYNLKSKLYLFCCEQKTCLIYLKYLFSERQVLPPNVLLLLSRHLNKSLFIWIENDCVSNQIRLHANSSLTENPLHVLYDKQNKCYFILNLEAGSVMTNEHQRFFNNNSSNSNLLNEAGRNYLTAKAYSGDSYSQYLLASLYRFGQCRIRELNVALTNDKSDEFAKKWFLACISNATVDKSTTFYIDALYRYCAVILINYGNNITLLAEPLKQELLNYLSVAAQASVAFSKGYVPAQCALVVAYLNLINTNPFHANDHLSQLRVWSEALSAQTEFARIHTDVYNREVLPLLVKCEPYLPSVNHSLI